MTDQNMPKYVSTATVLSLLAGMKFPEQGQAYDFMKRSLSVRDDYKRPESRSEALSEIMQTGFTLSGILAVTLAFPLSDEERRAANQYLDRLRDLDSRWADDIDRKIEGYLRAWGKLALEHDDFLHKLAHDLAKTIPDVETSDDAIEIETGRIHKLLVHVWNQALNEASERIVQARIAGTAVPALLADLTLPPVD